MSMSAAEKAEIAIRLVRECKEIAYDTETSGVDWKRNFPIGYVVTNDEHSVYVPVRHGGGGNLPDKNVRVPETATDPIVQHKFEKELAKAFDERRRLGNMTVGHNMKFDCHASANGGIMLGRRIICTQNRETLLDEYARRYSLEDSAERRKVAAKKSTQMYEHLSNVFGCPNDKKSMEHFWELSGDDPIAVEYAEGDGVTTLQLFRAQQPLIEEEDLQQIDNLESRLIWTLFRMERRGIKVDEGYLQATLEEIKIEVDRALEQLPHGFNPRSPKAVQKWVEEAGRTDWPTTDLGNPSFTEKFLKSFPEGKLIVDLRKWTNLKNSFILPLIEEHVFKGRVHSNLNQLKTDDLGTAARLSSSSPNMQAIPKHDKQLAPKFRRGFVADNEDMDFVEADLSQCEPRLFGHYSKDKRLVEGYSQEPFKDVHTIVAEMLHVDRGTVGKRMNMGIFTGMQIPTFSQHMGLPLEQAGDMWRAWYDLFPGVRDFQDTAIRVMRQRGYIRTLLGRRGRLDNPRFAYKAVSKIIQGGNADIIKWGLVEIDEELERLNDEAYLQMSVHDANVWQSPKGARGQEINEWVVNKMCDVQGPPFNLRVPFTADFGKGRNWKESSFGPDED